MFLDGFLSANIYFAASIVLSGYYGNTWRHYAAAQFRVPPLTFNMHWENKLPVALIWDPQPKQIAGVGGPIQIGATRSGRGLTPPNHNTGVPISIDPPCLQCMPPNPSCWDSLWVVSSKKTSPLPPSGADLRGGTDGGEVQAEVLSFVQCFQHNPIWLTSHLVWSSVTGNNQHTKGSLINPEREVFFKFYLKRVANSEPLTFSRCAVRISPKIHYKYLHEAVFRYLGFNPLPTNRKWWCFLICIFITSWTEP